MAMNLVDCVEAGEEEVLCATGELDFVSIVLSNRWHEAVQN